MNQASLIIVDDERLNADGIRMLIANSGLEVTIAGVFYSSTEALAFLTAHPVDIILTDIKMPHISGLELIGRIKAVKPTVEIIIFTGYGSLAYAQEAMQYGVKHFLEKPVSPDKLAASVAGCLADFRRHQQDSQLQIKQLVENVLLGAQDLAGVADPPFTLVGIDDGQFERVHAPLEHYLKRLGMHYIRVAHSGQILYCVFGRPQLQVPMVQIEQVHRGQHFIVVVLSQVTLATLPQAAAKSQALATLATYVTKPTIVVDAQPPVAARQRELLATWLATLQQAFKGDEQAPLIAFEHMIQQALVNVVLPVRLFQQFQQFLTEILAKADVQAAKRVAFLDAHREINTVSEARATIVALVTLLHEQAQSEAKTDIVQSLDRIIEQHYAENTLSLKWIANNLLYLNAEYMGKRYLQVTGKKFSQALAAVRMQRAAELLAQHYKVNEVARLVGFENNPDYFGQQFKRYYQMTPYRYQKQCD